MIRGLTVILRCREWTGTSLHSIRKSKASLGHITNPQEIQKYATQENVLFFPSHPRSKPRSERVCDSNDDCPRSMVCRQDMCTNDDSSGERTMGKMTMNRRRALSTGPLTRTARSFARSIRTAPLLSRAPLRSFGHASSWERWFLGSGSGGNRRR